MNAKVVAGLLATGLLVGCSTTNTAYLNTAGKNITVNLNVDDPGGAFDPVDIVAEISSVAKDCTSQYEGYVGLSQGANQIGLEPGERRYVLVSIFHTTFGRISNHGRGTYLTPKAGKKYEIDVNYVDTMFDFRLYEVRKSGRKQLTVVPEEACKPVK